MFFSKTFLYFFCNYFFIEWLCKTKKDRCKIAKVFWEMQIYESGWRTRGLKNNSGFLGLEQTITIPCDNRAVVARALGSREYQKHYKVRCVYFLSEIILVLEQHSITARTRNNRANARATLSARRNQEQLCERSSNTLLFFFKVTR